MSDQDRWQRIAALTEIPERGIVFAYRDGPFEESGILVPAGGGMRAWRNQCRHLAVRLDADKPGVVPVRAGRIVCGAHGAEYRADDGECVAGPCRGARLRALPVDVRDGQVFLDSEALPNTALLGGPTTP